MLPQDGLQQYPWFILAVPALLQVGSMMLENLVDIDWGDIRQAVPAFLTVAIMPLTYSVAYGVSEL